MSATLKQILDIAIGSTGVTVPSTWIGSNNLADANQLLAIANQSVLKLREYPFEKQVREHQFTLTSASSAYALPADYLNLVPDSMWIQNSLWRVDFPTDPTVWAYLTARGGPTGIQQRARLINGFLEFYEPQEGLVVGFEYVSNATITDGSTGAPKELFSQDSDVWLMDTGLITTDIKWRYKAEKGLEYKTDFELFKSQLGDVLGNDRGAKTIRPVNPWNPAPQTNLWLPET